MSSNSYDHQFRCNTKLIIIPKFINIVLCLSFVMLLSGILMFSVRRPHILDDIQRHQWAFCNTTTFENNGYISFHTTMPTFCNWSQVRYFDCDSTDEYEYCLLKAKNQFNNEAWPCWVTTMNNQQTIDCQNIPIIAEPNYFQDPTYMIGKSFMICGGSIFGLFLLFLCISIRTRNIDTEESQLLEA